MRCLPPLAISPSQKPQRGRGVRDTGGPGSDCLQERAPECHDLRRLLEIEIVRREGEASHRGVLEIHERGGLGSALRSVQRGRTNQFRSDQPIGSLYCEQTLDSHRI